MSISSSIVFEPLRIGFGLIIGVLLVIVIYCIRSTCIDIAACPDDFVMTTSPKQLEGSRDRFPSKVKEVVEKSINGDRRKIEYI